MSKFILIYGTNRVGKSSLARYIIEKNGGGVYDEKNNITRIKNACVVGSYVSNTRTSCGVDKIKNTKSLFYITKNAIEIGIPTIIAEGVKLHGVGHNVVSTAFLADRCVVIFLFCPIEKLVKRFEKKANFRAINSDQRSCFNSFFKWQKMGVKTYSFDTSIYNTESIYNSIKYEL